MIEVYKPTGCYQCDGCEWQAKTGVVMQRGDPEDPKCLSTERKGLYLCTCCRRKLQDQLDVLPDFDNQERCTILAALTLYRTLGCGDPEARSDWIQNIATGTTGRLDECVSLDDGGIAKLIGKVRKLKID